MPEKFLAFEQLSVPGTVGSPILDRIDLTIHRGEQWAITGPSGSGKTALSRVLTGRVFHTGQLIFFGATPRIAIVEQQHRFKNLSGTTDLYYQQRFNSSDAGGTITVEQELREYGINAENQEDQFHIRHLLTKPLIQLSNGENKRVQLAIALASAPDLLVLDNPFLGLDTAGRTLLQNAIAGMTRSGIQLLLIAGSDDIPEAITHIARLEQGKMVFAGLKEEYPAGRIDDPTGARSWPRSGPRPINATTPPPLPESLKLAARGGLERTQDFSIAVKMRNTTIRYGDTTILNNIGWEVTKGERWSVSGPNGAGKSTLLSLITADNPQAYANEIWLFDRRRGTGESIWDIKKKIGFVSPELHLYFDRSATCREVIASGLFDTIGLFRVLDEEQEERVKGWMQWLDIGQQGSKRMIQLSTGQQRMALLARALIKSPSLLILDEPCQGLDEQQTAYFRMLIGFLCQTFGSTLIYTTHRPAEIPDCVNRFLRLEQGLATESTSFFI
jgi:molybdate transport system ATP-binding protein